MYAFKSSDVPMSVEFLRRNAASPESRPDVPTAEVNYETDTALWYERQVALLRAGEFESLDVPNLIDELESMARRDKNELANRLAIVLVHLLKWQMQPEAISSGWIGTLYEQRDRIGRLLSDNPSFRRLVTASAATEFKRAVRNASLETRLRIDRFPSTNPFSVEQLLDENYFPSPIPDRLAVQED